MFALDKPFTWLVILVIILLIFGAGKLPEVGRSIGKSIKEFKVEANNPIEEENQDGARIAHPPNDPDLKPNPADPIRRKVTNHADTR